MRTLRTAFGDGIEDSGDGQAKHEDGTGFALTRWRQQKSCCVGSIASDLPGQACLGSRWAVTDPVRPAPSWSSAARVAIYALERFPAAISVTEQRAAACT